MSVPMSAAALDTAAVGAIVSVVGNYTLEALRDSEVRAQHKQQCAERLTMNDGRQVQYAEQAILANLDWGIDALEEAISTNNDETMIARLDHAEKMLQICALMDCRATTAGISNCYLSAWAHFNLAFVWKLRNNDRKAANHMLEMFLVDPFYSRVDFAPALWEHVFLPHLSNIVSWYTKQRQSIVVSGTSRKMSEESEMSFSMDCTSNWNDLQDLSGDQTSQLQALEKLYQDSLDENTRQYAKYYKDWLNYDMTTKKGMPLMPIAEPPMTPMADTWVPPTYGMAKLPDEQTPASARITATVAGPHSLGQERVSSSTSSKFSFAAEPGNEFTDFDNPEFVALAEDGLPGGLDDPDSPNSNVRRPGRELRSRMTTTLLKKHSESDQHMFIPASTNQEPASRTRPSRTSGRTRSSESPIRSDTATPPPFLEEVRTDAAVGRLSDKMNSGRSSVPLEVAASSGRSGLAPVSSMGVPDAIDYTSGASRLTADGKYCELRDNSTSPGMNPDSPLSLTGRRAPRLSSSTSRYVGSESKDGKVDRRAESDRFDEYGSAIRSSAEQMKEVFNKSSSVSPAGSSEGRPIFTSQESIATPEIDSSNYSDDLEALGDEIQEPKVEPRQRTDRDGDLFESATVTAPIRRMRFVSQYRSDGAAGSEGSLNVDSERYPNDNDEYLQSTPLPRFTTSTGTEVPSKSSESTRDYEDEWIHTEGQRYGGGESLGSIQSPISNSAMPRPPKDFVCPITSQLFNDPVTLETGQTYERKAIQEWLNRGNVTCPITRQNLRISCLPKTNYVLKRVVDGWKERNPEVAMEFGCSPLLTEIATTKSSSEFMELSTSSVSSMDSPGSGMLSRRFSRQTFADNNVNDRTRPTSPVDVDGLILNLELAVNCLCTSEILAECESVILEIAGLFQQAKSDQKLFAILNRAGAIAGMMDLLFSSQQGMILDATLSLLCIVVAEDDTTRQTVISADPGAGCLIGLLRKGITPSVSLLYQLKVPTQQLASLDLLPLLVVVIKETDGNNESNMSNGEPDLHSLMMTPKSAAIMLLDQILTGGERSTSSQNVQALVALQAVPALISSLDQAKHIDVRTSIVSLLLCCIQSDGRSRNSISAMDLAPVMDLLHSGNNRARTVAISFLNDLLHLNRRALCTGILQKMKTEGSLSSMRVLLVYLQMAPLEHRPVAASLLLQLDLLEEPCKRSMYREEAVESLVEALTSGDWPCPAEAANTLIALGGRFSYSGKPMMKAWLLKIAGLEKHFLSLTKDGQDSNEHDSPFDQEEEEKAATAWEKRVAGALVGHELGTLIEALGQGIQSKNPEVSKPCMIVATWLTHLLPKLPDTGIRLIARNCLLDHFVGVLQTSKDLQQRVLAALAVQSFISDPDGLQELLSYIKDISGPLRQLKRSTWIAKEILRAFTASVDVNSRDVWVHSERGQLDVTVNGAVRALIRARSRIFSGHSDGTIKIWDAKKRFPVRLQEHKEHTKAVTALTVSLNTNRLYSGSLDKSIRVWALGPVDISCVHVFDLKNAVLGLVFNGPMACIIPNGAGVKVQYEETATKLLNTSKHVHSLAISDGKIYCGCADNSIQELDPISESVNVIQHGVRTLLGKKPIYVTQVFQDHLYVAGAPVDGVAGKVWRISDNSLVGHLITTSEVRCMAISEDFIYLGASSGVIEVWLRERLSRVSTLNVGSKVICFMLDGDTLYSGSEDGKIRIWAMI